MIGSGCAGSTWHLWLWRFTITFDSDEQISGNNLLLITHSMQTVLFFITLNEAWIGENLDIWQYYAAPLCFSLRWKWGHGLHRQLTVWQFNINVTFNLFLLSQTKLVHQNYSKNKPWKGKFHWFVKGRSFWYTRRATSHKVVLAGWRRTHHQTPILLSILQTHQASKGHFAILHQSIKTLITCKGFWS